MRWAVCGSTPERWQPLGEARPENSRPEPELTARFLNLNGWRQRPAIERPPGSREFVDALLYRLKAERYRPSAWAQLLATAGHRSLQQVGAHPRAAVEVAGVFVALAALGGGRLRPVAGCLLALSHLGLLGERRSIGLANTLSLVRAGLPARRWAIPVAVATDLADGLVARWAGSTAFGCFADPLADLAFWTAVAGHPGSARLERIAIFSLWAAPVAAVTAGYLVAGRSIDYPRPVLIRRVSAVVQVVFAARRFFRAGPEPGRPEALSIDRAERIKTPAGARSLRPAIERRSGART